MRGWTRRALGRLLAGLAAVLLLPWSRRRRHPGRPPVIPEKPFSSKDLWKPHDYAG